MHKITFYPIGNADCCFIESEGGQNFLFDYADMRDKDDEDDRDERHHDGSRRVVADFEGQVADGGRQRERRRRGGQADGDAADESDRVVLQALVLDVVDLRFQYFFHGPTY